MTERKIARISLDVLMDDGSTVRLWADEPQRAEWDLRRGLPPVEAWPCSEMFRFAPPEVHKVAVSFEPSLRNPVTTEIRAAALPALPSFVAADVPPGTVVRLREDPSVVSLSRQAAFVAEKCGADLWRLASWPGRHLWDAEVQAEAAARGVDVLWPRFGDGR